MTSATSGPASSGGQQRRLDVAVAMVGNPELLFLDELTTGFDPSAQRAAWSLVASLRALGTTIFLTTHYLDEAEALADRVATICAGKIVAEGSRRSSAAGATPPGRSGSGSRRRPETFSPACRGRFGSMGTSPGCRPRRWSPTCT